MKDPLSTSRTKDFCEKFSYKITRWPQAHLPTDQVGGISEIIAVDEIHLLVLERCYVKRDNKDKVLCILNYVLINEDKKSLNIQNCAFDFSGIPLCNVEGMAWADSSRTTLVIIADDGLGPNFNNDDPTFTTLKNQVTILKRIN